MQKRSLKSFILGLGMVSCIVWFLFAALRLPVMEVVRRNAQSGIDADAYFYSQIEGFKKYEEAVARKRLQRNRLSER